LTYQSAEGKSKRRQLEINSLISTEDSFKKIVIVKEDIIPWHDDNGILYLGTQKFLLDENALDL